MTRTGTRAVAGRARRRRTAEEIACGFDRAADVYRRIRWGTEVLEWSAAAVRAGRAIPFFGGRLTPARALRHVAATVSMNANLQATPAPPFLTDGPREVRAVVRAYILHTQLARSTIARVLPLGGWRTEFAILVLGRE